MAKDGERGNWAKAPATRPRRGSVPSRTSSSPRKSDMLRPALTPKWTCASAVVREAASRRRAGRRKRFMGGGWMGGVGTGEPALAGAGGRRGWEERTEGFKGAWWVGGCWNRGAAAGRGGGAGLKGQHPFRVSRARDLKGGDVETRARARGLTFCCHPTDFGPPPSPPP